MHKFIILACCLGMFSACQVDTSLVQETNLQQQTHFQNGAIKPGKLYTFKVPPTGRYRPEYTQEANDIVFAHRAENWTTGEQALLRMANRIIQNAQGDISFSNRVDLETITYYNLDNFIFPAPPSTARAAAAAQNLRLIFTHGQPTETGRLAKALQLAATALSPDETSNFKSRIQAVAESILARPEAYHPVPHIQAYLREEAEKAFSVLPTI